MTELLPDLPGLVTGIVGNAPWMLQCHDCGTTVTGADLDIAPTKVALLVILSGFHFHTCEGTGGVRRCPSCLKESLAACAKRDHRRD